MTTLITLHRPELLALALDRIEARLDRSEARLDRSEARLDEMQAETWSPTVRDRMAEALA